MTDAAAASPDRADRLRCLLAPRSIAIIGASADFNKLNGRVMKFLLEKGYGGAIYPVNPKYAEIGGRRCYPDIGAVGDTVDLAVVTVPAAGVLAQVEACGVAGVGAAVVFSSGFGEMGEDGRAAEAQLVSAARRHGLRLCGPNTLGLINAFDNVYATFTQYGMASTLPGPVGFVSQSGAFGTAIAALARRRGMGLGYFINTGNESDVTIADCLDLVMADPRIKVGAAYIEGLTDGPGFVRVAQESLNSGKPLVVTKVGRTGTGAQAASSHTGALAGEDVVFDGVGRPFGVCRARNEEHMLDIVDLFTSTKVPHGRGVAIVTQSGGAGVLMSDRAEEVGLEVPSLAPSTVTRLRQVLPVFASIANPVDVTAQFIADPSMLTESVKAVLDDPQVDVAVVWLQLMDGFVDKLAETFRQIRDETTKPFVVAWVAAPEAGLKALRDLGIGVMRGAEPAIDAIAALVEWGEARAAWQADASARARMVLPPPSLPAAAGPLPTVEAAVALSDAGVPLVAAELAQSADQAVAAAARIGYPVALKIESPDILHKTEAGGVMIGLRDADAVRFGFESIVRNAAQRAVEERVSGVVVQAMGSGQVEMVIGLRNDPAFGPVVMAGLGGIFVEVLKDVVFARAPVTEAQAHGMLERLRGKALLDGWRGAPPIDRAALARCIAAVSKFGAANADRLVELDLNPVLAGPDGTVAVDWLLVSRE